VLLADARWMPRTSATVKMSHVPREGNSCADWVTKWARQTRQNVEITEDSPHELVDLAAADARGVSFERL